MDLFAVLFESVIRFPARQGFPGLVKQAGPHCHWSIEFRDKKPDLQKGGTVENVHVLDVQLAFLDLVQLKGGKPVWVRTLGRCGDEEFPSLRIHERSNVKVESGADNLSRRCCA